MFLHIGGDHLILKKDIVVILDEKTMARSEANKQFLSKHKINKKDIDEKFKEKSFILTNNKVFTSSISSLTLKKRSDHLKEILEEVKIKG
jgi:extracellular matrix regulatory protein B